MSCDRDPLDVYRLAERGEDDPHLVECAECRGHLAERARLVAALPRSLTAIAVDEDEEWQARVWAQIAAQRDAADYAAVQHDIAAARRSAPRSLRWSWTTHCAMAGLAMVVAVAALWPGDEPAQRDLGALSGAQAQAAYERATGRFELLGSSSPLSAVFDERPRVEIIPGPQAGRASLQVGDRIRVLARDGDRIWIYREEQPVLRCWGASGGSGCSSDTAGSRAELMLGVAGEYQVAVIQAHDFAELASPASFTVELANVVRQNGTYRSYDFSVH